MTVPLPYGETELCPVRALDAWLDAAGITEGPVFRRIWLPASGKQRSRGEMPANGGHSGRPAEDATPPLPRIGTAALTPQIVARDRPGPRRRRRFWPARPRRPQPQARRAHHRHGSRRPPGQAQAARPPQKLRRARRISGVRRPVRGPSAQRCAIGRTSAPRKDFNGGPAQGDLTRPRKLIEVISHPADASGQHVRLQANRIWKFLDGPDYRLPGSTTSSRPPGRRWTAPSAPNAKPPRPTSAWRKRKTPVTPAAQQCAPGAAGVPGATSLPCPPAAPTSLRSWRRTPPRHDTQHHRSAPRRHPLPAPRRLLPGADRRCLRLGNRRRHPPQRRRQRAPPPAPFYASCWPPSPTICAASATAPSSWSALPVRCAARSWRPSASSGWRSPTVACG